jgi:TolB-like protein
MGEVWKAHDTRLGRLVAIKFSKEQFSRRFSREAKAIAALNHPNICTIYDVGPDYIVMEYVDGRPLEGPLPIARVLEYAIQIAQALAEAHRKGIIHRDLKPGNVLVTANRVKVLDFGLAKRLDEGPAYADSRTQSLQTEAGVVVGTPAYMSPEQAQGLELDHRSDIFSFAAVLYELLTGRRAFHRVTYAETISAILRDEVPPVSQQVRGLSTGIDHVFAKALAKDATERYDSAIAFTDDLKRVQQQLDTASAPIVHKAASRRRRMSGAVAAAAALVVLAAAVYFMAPRWQSHTNAIHSLAVLPLKPLSNDPEDKLLEVGIADTVISKISRVGGLTVRPTSAVRKYAALDIQALVAANELHVESVLEGTLQRAGSKLRVTVNLLRVDDGASLWSETFDTTTTDIFAIQDEIARQLADRLSARISSANRQRLNERDTSSVEALQAFQAALQDFDRRNFTSTGNAIPLFERATQLDQKYARAYALLAYCFAWHALFIDPANAAVWITKSEEAASAADRLNAGLAETHLARGELLWSAHRGWRIDDAIREFQTATAQDPNVGHGELGTIFAHLGLVEKAGFHFNRALEVDPLSANTRSRYVEHGAMLGQYEEALRSSRRLFNRDGPIEALLALKRVAEAKPLIESSLKTGSAPRVLGNQALLLAIEGRFTEAERLISSIEQGKLDRGYHHAALSVAGVFGLQGKTSDALKWLQVCASTGMPNHLLFSRDPSLENIRSRPEIQRFLVEMKRAWEQYRQRYG